MATPCFLQTSIDIDSNACNFIKRPRGRPRRSAKPQDSVTSVTTTDAIYLAIASVPWHELKCRLLVDDCALALHLLRVHADNCQDCKRKRLSDSPHNCVLSAQQLETRSTTENALKLEDSATDNKGSYTTRTSKAINEYSLTGDETSNSAVVNKELDPDVNAFVRISENDAESHADDRESVTDTSRKPKVLSQTPEQTNKRYSLRGSTSNPLKNTYSKDFDYSDDEEGSDGSLNSDGISTDSDEDPVSDKGNDQNINLSEKLFQSKAKREKRSRSSDESFYKYMMVKEKEYECTICNLVHSRPQLTLHMQKHITVRKNVDLYRCDACKTTFKENAGLRRHVRIHHSKTVRGKKEFSCTLCNKSFKRRTGAAKHVRIHTGEKPLLCSICGETFSYEGGIKRHMMDHSGERPYPCTLCSKEFKVKSQLQRHLEVHADIRPYLCQICGKPFRENSKLKVHMNKHTGDKPYRCRQSNCEKSFSQLNIRNRHEIVHTGVRPFSCEVCGKCVGRKDELKQHMRSHRHKIKQKHVRKSTIVDSQRDKNDDTDRNMLAIMQHYQQDPNQFDSEEGNLVPKTETQKATEQLTCESVQNEAVHQDNEGLLTLATCVFNGETLI